MSAAEQIEAGIGTGVGGQYEGKAIVGAAVEIPNVAGGLREAMKFGAVTIEHGEPFFLVLSGVCQKVRYDPDNKEEPGGDQIRVHILNVAEGTFVAEQVVIDALKRQREIIDEGRRQEEAAKGIHRLPLGNKDDEKEFVLATEHAAGEHPDSDVADCPVCLVEADNPEDDDEAAVLVRQHLQGVHADGLREACVMCRTETAAVAEEQAAEQPRKRRGR